MTIDLKFPNFGLNFRVHPIYLPVLPVSLSVFNLSLPLAVTVVHNNGGCTRNFHPKIESRTFHFLFSNQNNRGW